MARTVKAPDERRQELLGIGLELYMQKGAAGISVKEVVARANVATGLFYYYFESKELFVEEALNSYITGKIGNIVDVLQSDGLNTIQKVSEGLCVFLEHAKNMAPYMQDTVLQSQQHHILMDKLLLRLQPCLEDLIKTGNCDGSFHAKDPALIATFILHGLLGIMHSEMELSEEKMEEKMREVKEVIFTLLGAEHQGENAEYQDKNEVLKCHM